MSDQVSGDTGTEAAPCPFCGAPHAKVSPAQEHRGPGWAVRCERCLAQGPAHEAGSAALALWNEAARALAPEPSEPRVVVTEGDFVIVAAPADAKRLRDAVRVDAESVAAPEPSGVPPEDVLEFPPHETQIHRGVVVDKRERPPLGLPVGATTEVERVAPEMLARRFHEAYERLAPSFGYETRKESAVPWEQVPEKNRALMTAVCATILSEVTIPKGEL